MPEGPEVQRFADQLHLVLANQNIIQLTARTQAAKRWLAEHPNHLIGRKVRHPQQSWWLDECDRPWGGCPC